MSSTGFKASLVFLALSFPLVVFILETVYRIKETETSSLSKLNIDHNIKKESIYHLSSSSIDGFKHVSEVNRFDYFSVVISL